MHEMIDERIDAALLGMKLLDYLVLGLYSPFRRQDRYLQLKYKSNILWNKSFCIEKDFVRIFILPHDTDNIGIKIMEKFHFDRFTLTKQIAAYYDNEEYYELRLYGNIDSIIEMITEFDDWLPTLDILVHY